MTNPVFVREYLRRQETYRYVYLPLMYSTLIIAKSSGFP